MALFSSDESSKGDGIITGRRQPTEHPLSPRCQLHLQRICGTCTHYQGALKPAEGQDRAPCSFFQIETHRQRRAWSCGRWSRKTGGGNG